MIDGDDAVGLTPEEARQLRELQRVAAHHDRSSGKDAAAPFTPHSAPITKLWDEQGSEGTSSRVRPAQHALHDTANVMVDGDRAVGLSAEEAWLLRELRAAHDDDLRI